ncbi:MAG: DUF642 domain-containing protein [Thermoguttaceae bacterium]
MESLECRKLMTVTTLTVNSISDGSFEAPALTANNYQVAPASSPWVFSGISGVSRNNSAFTTGDPKAPEGAQVAFIQDNASVSQIVSLDAGVYNLSLLAAQRVNYQSQPQEIEVLIDGAEVGMIVPNSPVTTNNVTYTTSYSAYQTPNFTVTAGTHTVEFLGMSPSTADSTAFIDSVAITPAVDSIIDGGFETPALVANAYQADPDDSAWQFSGTAGVARNGSDFLTNWTEAQNAPAGAQVGYIEYNGSMSQTVYLDAGSYQLSCLAAQRAIYQTHYQEIEVMVDGAQVGTINPVNNLYGSYQSSTFAVTTGVHTIEFLGLDPLGGDNTAFIDQVTLSANAIDDGSFETPSLAAGSYQFAPAGSPWQFSGTAGLAHNGSNFTSSNPNAPNGTQVALIQGNGSLSQSVDLVAGEYNISFMAAQRGNGQPQGQEIEVEVDGAPVGLITPVGTGYRLYETSNFTVTAGMNTIQFVGMNPQSGNGTALIDEVVLAQAQDEIIDGGFETPALPANTYQNEPSGTPWQFSGLAGISGNNSGLTSGTANAPQGSQVGFLMNNASMSQTIYLDAETYDISFMAAQRVTDQSQSQQIEVLVDGAQVALVTPSVVNSNFPRAYTLFQTSTFTVAAGLHTIEFLGMSPQTANSTAFIDDVAIATDENTFSDGGFESPVLAVDAYAVAPAGCSWQFSGTAGVTANNSGFTYVTNGTAYAPDGAQAAFIKNNGSMSQTVDFDAGTYNVSFLASQRILYQTQDQQIEVLVDGAPVALITPAVSTTFASTKSDTNYTYTPYQTSNFTVTAGPHTVEFLGMSPSSADSTAFIDDAVINTGCSLIDGSFEEPALAAKAYEVAPSGTSWQFSGVAGVSSNASSFTFGNPVAPEGDQVAFIKDNASMSQSVYLAAGVYNLSFMAAQRHLHQTQDQTLEILVDGAEVGIATPDSDTNGNYPAGTSFGLYATSNFTVSAGVHTIEFVGLSPATADSTALIDDVQLNV